MQSEMKMRMLGLFSVATQNGSRRLTHHEWFFHYSRPLITFHSNSKCKVAHLFTTKYHFTLIVLHIYSPFHYVSLSHSIDLDCILSGSRGPFCIHPKSTHRFSLVSSSVVAISSLHLPVFLSCHCECERYSSGDSDEADCRQLMPEPTTRLLHAYIEKSSS